MHRVARLSRLLRWVAWSQMPEEYRDVAGSDKDWPEATTFAIWWQGAEDYVLRAWVDRLMTFKPTHLSLHYDGVRVDLECINRSNMSVSEFCQECSRHIAAVTGFSVRIVPKEHRRLLELLRRLPPRKS